MYSSVSRHSKSLCLYLFLSLFLSLSPPLFLSLSLSLPLSLTLPLSLFVLLSLFISHAHNFSFLTHTSCIHKDMWLFLSASAKSNKMPHFSFFVSSVSPLFFPCRCQELWRRSRAATLSFALAEMCVAACCIFRTGWDVCCSLLQSVAACCIFRTGWDVCCSVLQSVAVCCSVLHLSHWLRCALQCVAVAYVTSLARCMGEACCSVLQRVAACCSVLHERRVAVCCSGSCDMPRPKRKTSQRTEDIVETQLRLPESFGPNHRSFFLSVV